MTAKTKLLLLPPELTGGEWAVHGLDHDPAVVGALVAAWATTHVEGDGVTIEIAELTDDEIAVLEQDAIDAEPEPDDMSKTCHPHPDGPGLADDEEPGR